MKFKLKHKGSGVEWGKEIVLCKQVFCNLFKGLFSFSRILFYASSCFVTFLKDFSQFLIFQCETYMNMLGVDRSVLQVLPINFIPTTFFIESIFFIESRPLNVLL